MKKLLAFALFLAFISYKSQYLIIGKDSISAEKFKTENTYGLENSGIDKTVKSYIDFKLLQNFALDKKADTLSYFKKRMAEKEMQLREAYFYPSEVMQSSLQQYFSANQIEKKIQIFYIEKAESDATDYNKIYNEVKSGKITMEDAITTYTKQKPDAFFVKSGSLDVDLDKELQAMQTGSYTSLINSAKIVAFAKLLDKRPSLGYLVFGTISYPNNADAEKIKTNIYDALKSGKKFEEVAKLYGSTEAEKKKAGVVMGSPVLPDAVYEALKNKKQGEYTEPILLGEKYYVFNVYSLIPYQKSDRYDDMFIKDMMNSQFSEVPYNQLIDNLVKSKDYKEYPDFAKIKKSYADYLAFKNDNAVLYQFAQKNFKFGDLKKLLSENFKNGDKLTKEQWALFLDSKRDNDVFGEYSDSFLEKKEVQEELKKLKQNLLADYLFSYWIEEELKNNPKLMDDYFSAHKNQYVWESRADARVAIITDLSTEKEITKEIVNPKDWEALNKKYYGKTNDKNQLLVHFEKGEMSENADVFKIHKIPFGKGIHKVKIDDKLLVIAIDGILPSSPMTREEASEELKDDVTEDILNKTIAAQRSKTNVTVEPSFLKELSKNFKK